MLTVIPFSTGSSIEKKPAAKIIKIWKFKISKVDAWMNPSIAADIDNQEISHKRYG